MCLLSLVGLSLNDIGDGGRTLENNNYCENATENALLANFDPTSSYNY